MKTNDFISDGRRFSHEAMHTTFDLRIRGMDASLAQGMARECFDQLDVLESKLSRFLDGSDVSRINRLAAGETLFISEECHECLLAALEGYVATGGLFDITLGAAIEHQKSGASGEPLPVTGVLTIHPDVPAVTCDVPGRVIDLGGIGKGYALDMLGRLLHEWGTEDALLSAGASSISALGRESWPVDLTGDSEVRRIFLCEQALSASGTRIQGSHIVHPAGQSAMPAVPSARVWVMAASATLAEIWSTALMLVDEAEISALLAGNHGVAQVFTENGGVIQSLWGPSAHCVD